MNRHRPVFGTLGAVLVLFGVALFLIPALSSVGPVRRVLGFIDAAGTTRLLLLTGGGLVGYLLVGLRSPAENDTEPTAGRFEPESRSERPGPREGVTGFRTDRQIQRAIENGGEEFVAVREYLRRTASSVYQDVVGCSPEQARSAVERGAWCSDPLVAAFLADVDGPVTPFEAQVRLFVFPRRERRRRIERTVAVIEEVHGQ